jgi:hypothetical protein
MGWRVHTSPPSMAPSSMAGSGSACRLASPAGCARYAAAAAAAGGQHMGGNGGGGRVLGLVAKRAAAYSALGNAQLQNELQPGCVAPAPPANKTVRWKGRSA